MNWESTKVNYAGRVLDSVRGPVQGSSLGAQKPLLTVGICAYTEVDSVENLVDTSLRSRLGEFTRVVVVTPNRILAARLSQRDSRVNVILENRREGKTSAMNKMLRMVEGEVLVYASGDAAVGLDAIPALADALLSNPRYGAVIAHVTLTNQGIGIMGRIGVLIWELFNGVSQRLDDDSRLAQANDLYAFKRDLVGEIPLGIINDDTYIAASIRRRGYLVKKSNFEVKIAGPSNPYDYVIQRSRIVTGHMQTIKTQRVVPTVFEFTMLSSPARNLKILVNTLSARGLRFFGALIVAANLELVTWTNSMLGALMRKDTRIWKVAQSTKKLSQRQEG